MKALLNAYKLRDRKYLESALNLIHEETTFVVSDHEELTNDVIKKVSILHALYSVCLGMIKSMEGGEVRGDHKELISRAINESDITSLTEALVHLTIRTLNGDYSWVNEVETMTNNVPAALIISIIREFLNLVRLISASTP